MYKSWDFKHRSSSESNNRKNNGVFLLWPPGRQLNITLEGFMCERDWQASIFKPAVASSSNSHAYSMWCAPRIIYSTLVEKDERFTLCTCRKSSLLSSPCFLPLVVILLRVCVLKKQAVVDERATLYLVGVAVRCKGSHLPLVCTSEWDTH